MRCTVVHHHHPNPTLAYKPFQRSTNCASPLKTKTKCPKRITNEAHRSGKRSSERRVRTKPQSGTACWTSSMLRSTLAPLGRLQGWLQKMDSNIMFRGLENSEAIETGTWWWKLIESCVLAWLSIRGGIRGMPHNLTISLFKLSI